MLEYIKGIIAEAHPTHVIVEQGGLGYFLHISLHTYSQIQSLPEVKLYTYQYIREDIRMMFGFSQKKERQVFELLLSISGIGPNTTRLILSSLTTDQVVQAIAQEDDIAFKNVKGIGAKTAKRIIIDLKDKIQQIEIPLTSPEVIPIQNTENKNLADAREALLTLGFPKNKIQMVLNKLKKEKQNETVENIIKDALKLMS